MDPDTILLVAFLLGFGGFLILFRKRLAIEPIIKIGKVPLLSLVLLRTSVGITAMDSLARRYPRLVSAFSTAGIVIGFIGMTFVTFEIISSAISFVLSPSPTGAAALVLPIKAKGVLYVPFVVWLISLGVIVAIHEFAHGVVARLYYVPIKSSGLAALCAPIPLIPAAFVEPDDKSLSKKSAREQLGVFVAGPFANILLAILLIPIVWFCTMPLAEGLYDYQGARIIEVTTDEAYPISSSGITAGAIVKSIDDVPIRRVDDFMAALSQKSKDQIITIVSVLDGNSRIDTVALGPHPAENGAGYLGVQVESAKSLIEDTWTSQLIVFIHDLLSWLAVLSLGVGLFNLLPLGIVDGGRMIKLILHRALPERHAWATYATVSASCLVVVVLGVVVNFIR
ncbi:MAG TPA: site-2 protease family protein [Candidatus Nanoarchaeia archaeon]|nr:site-2 protease family protein [Candidatus Nanoarchaeia archaeon]